MIFDSLIIHPARHSFDSHNHTFAEIHWKNYKEALDTIIFPAILKMMTMIGRSGDSKVLFVHSEDALVGPARYYMIEQNNYFDKKFREDPDFAEYYKSGRLGILAASQDMVYPNGNELSIPYGAYAGGPPGHILLQDRFHMMRRREDTNIPSTLWAKANLIFNWFCNQEVFSSSKYKSKRDSMCCTSF